MSAGPCGFHFSPATYVALLGAACFFAAACHTGPDPQKLYDQVLRDTQHGDLRIASADADHALASYKGQDPLWLWRFRIQKAGILVFRSLPNEALELLKGDVPSSPAALDIAVRKNVVEGLAYKAKQDFEKSAERLRLAETLATGSGMRFLCEVLNARGALEVNQGRIGDARATYRQAAQLARQYHRPDQEAGALVSLAWVAIKEEHFDEAVEQGQAALQHSRSLDMQGMVAVALGNLGYSYSELGDFESALEFYKQAAEISERLGLSGYALYWSTGVANSLEALRDPASAEVLSKHTLELARTLNNMETVTECLNDLAAFALETGKPDLGEQYITEALHLEEQGLDHFGSLQSRLIGGRIEATKRHFSAAEGLYRQVMQDPKAETALRWESQARLAELHAEQGMVGVAASEFGTSIATIETARASIQRDDLRLSFLAGGIEFYDDYVDFLVAHGRSDDALRVAELSRARTLTEGLASTSQAASLSTRNLKPQQIAQKMRTTFLFYWVGQNRSHLWVIAPGGISHFDLPKASDLEPLVKSYRDAVLRMRDPRDADGKAGLQLYAILVAPAKKLIPNGSRVTMLPDASLSALNFETLVAPDPQPHFWIEDVTVTTASSLTLLAASTARRPSKASNLLLIGNTVQPNDDFPTLGQAPAEMQMIEHYFPAPRREVLEGAQATPSAYLASKPERFAYLHFVTHGTASVTRPLESAVILSKEGDSYKLYARDILQHPLSAQLVTISACEGAGKRAYSGEGLVGLSWAFLRAGAHNVVGALWEVSDSSTPQFMNTFYDQLGQGKDPATALRAAKLSLLHSADPASVFRKPYYWAPFQLYAGS